MPQLLIELFSEEIPARMQQGAARDLERMATERLKAAGLSWEALTTFAGPRRLTLVVEGLPAATPDRNEEVRGPRASAPEQALEGFLRKTGLTRADLTERDGFFHAAIAQPGQPTTELVGDILEQIIRTFPWPKSMRWGDGSLRWVRPLKRILAVYDGAVIPFELDDIVAENITEGHRFLGSRRPFAVRDFAEYRAKLESDFVLLDVVDRKLRILEGAKAACAARGLVPVDDDGLLDEVAGLAEWPTPILGDMDPAFLDLPPEVIRLSMKVHQKYFAVRHSSPTGGSTREAGEGGFSTAQLAPHFVVVANVEATDCGRALAAGNSRVLSARLDDARFFWDEDLKTGFEVWGKKLEGVTFHAKLGTLAERVERIAALAREIAPLVGADPDQAEAAARLAKADLASAMVGEFPELQGVMGGYYARAAGYPDAIADAVRDHYKPQGPADTVPTAPLTVAVALADKLDTLVGFFAIDEKPTGSKDPFALRRAALGVIRLVLENSVRMNLHYLSVEHAKHLTGKEYLSVVGPVETLLSFIEERLKVALRDEGYKHDYAEAAFATVGTTEIFIDQLVVRLKALDAFLATDDGVNLLAGYKRATNILKAEEKKGPVPTGMVQTGLPGQPNEETALAFAAAAAATAVDAALATEDFAAAMTALAALRAPVDAFFTGVMVNSDVAEERDNRLKLLGQVRAVMGRVADFGMIAG